MQYRITRDHSVPVDAAHVGVFSASRFEAGHDAYATVAVPEEILNPCIEAVHLGCNRLRTIHGIREALLPHLPKGHKVAFGWAKDAVDIRWAYLRDALASQAQE